MKVDVRRGNSGGPVLDDGGAVVGVVVAKIDTPKHFSRTGELVERVGVAIRNEIVFAFFRHYRVQVSRALAAPLQDDEARLRHARAFVAQVGCWR